MKALAMPRWPGWRHLPREARDTIFLICVIGWTVLPHVSHLPEWCVALTLVVLVWRTALALTHGTLPSRWILMTVLAVAAGLTFWSYRTLFGKEPGVTLAVVLMALKTLELRARRDAFVVFFLGFFIVLTHFLYSQTLPYAIAMLVSVWGLLTALVLAHMPVGQPSLRQAATLAARTAALGAPIMLLLFALFPRIGPLWGVPQDGISSTGLSNTLKLGSIARLVLDDGIAMRLKFSGPPPPPEAMYFRGPVLSRFDGVEWRPRPSPPGVARSRSPQEAALLRTSGAPVHYEVTLEPVRLSTVPTLEATTTAPDIEGVAVVARPDLTWLADRPLFERVRFEADAYPAFHYGPLRADPWVAEDRALPAGSNPRLAAWAEGFRRAHRLNPADARAIAAALYEHIRTGGYTYTLDTGAYGADALDEFWLDRKEGFCEHFAAAFVFAMRAMGVPARIVTGYQGTESMPVDGYWIVRQSSAHAWAEFWQPGAGWVRADPTAAVAPDRIVRSRRLAPAPGLFAGALESVDPALLARLRTAWELTNNRWNQWVLSYSRGQQLDLLKNVGFRAPAWDDLALVLIVALSTLALAAAVWAWWDRRRVDPWVRQMEQLRDALRGMGVGACAHEAPRTLALRVRERLGARAEPLAEMLEAFERQRYAPGAATRPDRAFTRRFKAEARRLRTGGIATLPKVDAAAA
jgi:transglutaminase-like putative cysteine protease